MSPKKQRYSNASKLGKSPQRFSSKKSVSTKVVVTGVKVIKTAVCEQPCVAKRVKIKKAVMNLTGRLDKGVDKTPALAKLLESKVLELSWNNVKYKKVAVIIRG